jgi:serine phosphatase RsbU (regulator of sigma subunit)
VAPALVLGVDPEASFATERVKLSPAGALLFYTDGVIEARAPDGEHFTITRLRRALEDRERQTGHDGRECAQGLVDAVVAAVTDFRGPRDLLDDLTLVAVQLQPAPGPGPTEPSRFVAAVG